MWNLLNVLLPLLINVQTSFKIRLLQKKLQRIGLKTWNWLRVEVITWNSWSKLEKKWKLQGSSTKKPHSLGVFLAWGFSRGVTHFYGSSFAMTWEFSRIFDTDLGVYKKAFSQPPCLFFFLEQTTVRKIDLLFLVLRYPAPCSLA